MKIGHERTHLRFPILSVAAGGNGVDGGNRRATTGEKRSSGSTLDEAELRKLIDQLGVEQFRLREDATKRLSELADVPPALRAAMKSDNAEASRRGSVSVWFVVTAFRRCFTNPLKRVTTN
jgi:hypothetical protein